MLKRFLALVFALLFLAWIQVVLIHVGITPAWRVMMGEADRLLQPAELAHYTLLLVLGMPAAVLFALAWSAPAFGKVAGVLARGSYWLPAVWTSVATFSVSHFITQGAWFTDDEQAYLFQMQCYLKGALAVPALSPERPFHHAFVVISRLEDGVPWWAGAYPIMQPLMMALSSLFGSPLISQWLCAGAIAYHTGKLAETLTGERRLGLCAAWLCTASPMLVGLASTYHTSVLACLLSLLSLRACLHAQRAPSFGRGALVGILAGATFLTRGLEGSLMVVTTGAALLWWSRAALRGALPMFVGFGVSGAAALSVYFAINLGTTGDMLDTAYAVWARELGSIMGFGTNMMWGRSHTVPHAMSQTFTTLVRMNTWIFGWPSSLLIPLLGLLSPLRSSGVVWLLALSALQLLGYSFLAFGSVHDFGAAYHVWHLPWLAVATVLVLQSARSYSSLARGTARFDTNAGPRLLFGMMVVGLLAFWPTQLEKWNVTATATLAPIRAAQEAAQGRRAIVLWRSMHTPGVASWVHMAPAPFPDAPLLWARDEPFVAEQLGRAFPDRVLLRLSWDGNLPRVVEAGGAVREQK